MAGVPARGREINVRRNTAAFIQVSGQGANAGRRAVVEFLAKGDIADQVRGQLVAGRRQPSHELRSTIALNEVKLAGLAHEPHNSGSERRRALPNAARRRLFRRWLWRRIRGRLRGWLRGWLRRTGGWGVRNWQAPAATATGDDEKNRQHRQESSKHRSLR